MKVGNIDNLTLRRAAIVAALPLSVIALTILDLLIVLVDSGRPFWRDYTAMVRDDYSKIWDAARRSWYD